MHREFLCLQVLNCAWTSLAVLSLGSAQAAIIQIGPGHYDGYNTGNQEYVVVAGTEIVPPENNSELSMGTGIYYGKDAVIIDSGAVFRMEDGLIHGGDARTAAFVYDAIAGDGIMTSPGTQLEFHGGIVSGGDSYVDHAYTGSSNLLGGGVAVRMNASQAVVYGGQFLGGVARVATGQTQLRNSFLLGDGSHLDIHGGSFEGEIGPGLQSSITVYGSEFNFHLQTPAVHYQLDGKYANGDSFSIPFQLVPGNFATIETPDSFTITLEPFPEPSSLILGCLGVGSITMAGRRLRRSPR